MRLFFGLLASSICIHGSKHIKGVYYPKVITNRAYFIEEEMQNIDNFMFDRASVKDIQELPKDFWRNIKPRVLRRMLSQERLENVLKSIGNENLKQLKESKAIQGINITTRQQLALLPKLLYTQVNWKFISYAKENLSPKIYCLMLGLESDCLSRNRSSPFYNISQKLPKRIRKTFTAMKIKRRPKFLKEITSILLKSKKFKNGLDAADSRRLDERFLQLKNLAREDHSRYYSLSD